MEPGVALFVLGLRIVGILVCVNKAKELNRSTGSWGFFGFVFPVIAMISIQFMKPITVWHQVTNNQIENENE